MNIQAFKDSSYILVSALVVYTVAALLGVWAGDFEPGSMWGVILANAATVVYKIGHIPLATSASPITAAVLCELTGCKESLSERDRDLLVHFIFAVLFVGLCFAR